VAIKMLVAHTPRCCLRPKDTNCWLVIIMTSFLLLSRGRQNSSKTAAATTTAATTEHATTFRMSYVKKSL